MRDITVLDLFDRTAEKYPDNTAVIQEERSVSYGELKELSQRIGSSLFLYLEGRVQKPVSIFMEKGIECLSSMLGIMYSGNIYVPMDVKTPEERLRSILGTLKSSIIICMERDRKRLSDMGFGDELLVYEDIISGSGYEREGEGLNSVRKNMTDMDLMYVLFTSGSTGIPKGVAIRHRSVLDYVDAYVDDVGVSPEDILGNQTPFYADMSLKDIYMAFSVGAAVCIIPQTYFMSPKKLLNYLNDKKVTSIAWVPTAYQIVASFKALDIVRPEYLRTFVFSGESMQISVFEYWRKYYPDGDFIQNYGPTEITGACTSYHVKGDVPEEGFIPIGRPYRNTGILLLDEKGGIIKDKDTDAAGEICVYGSCLAAGYYNNRERTDEVFVRNPLYPETVSLMYKTGDIGRWDGDGNLVFVSRKDYQIKHGGRRIELGEIEAAADSIDEISMCCAVQNRDKDELVLYYSGDIDKDSIKEHLGQRLPKYMIPVRYEKRDTLPILPNGKLDRKTVDGWVNQK